MKKLAAVIALLAGSLCLNAQDSAMFKSSRSAAVVPHFTFNQVFIGDYLMGFGVGGFDQTHCWGGALQFDFRPYFRRVTFNENDTLRQQYREKDFFISLCFEKQFRLKTQYPMLRPFIQLNAGLLWGNFKAFDKAPENKWIITPAAGLCLAFNPVISLKLGYQYLKPLVIPTNGHRMTLQLVINIDDV